MATDLRDFRQSATELCKRSWCPACAGHVYPAEQAGDDLILCACECCGYILICRDLGQGGEYLTAPGDELWQRLLATRGEQIQRIRREINLGERNV